MRSMRPYDVQQGNSFNRTWDMLCANWSLADVMVKRFDYQYMDLLIDFSKIKQNLSVLSFAKMVSKSSFANDVVQVCQCCMSGVFMVYIACALCMSVMCITCANDKDVEGGLNILCQMRVHCVCPWCALRMFMMCVSRELNPWFAHACTCDLHMRMNMICICVYPWLAHACIHDL